MALAFERIARKAHAPARLAMIELHQVDRGALPPQPAGGQPQALPLAFRLIRKRGDRRNVVPALRGMLARRAATPEFHAKNATEILQTGNRLLFAFARRAPTGAVVCVFNFSDTWQTLPASWVLQQGASQLHDILSDSPVGDANGAIPLPPYARVWIR